MKLLITILITLLLPVHMQPIDLLASAVAKTTVLSADLGGLRIQMVAYAATALSPSAGFLSGWSSDPAYTRINPTH